MLPFLMAAAALLGAVSNPSPGKKLQHWGSFQVESHQIGGSFEVEIVSDTLPQLGGAKRVRLIRTEHLRTSSGNRRLKVVVSSAESAACPAISERLSVLKFLKLPGFTSPFSAQPGSKAVLLDGATSKINVPLEGSDDGSQIEISIASYEQPM